jgi:hypothetical protein
MLETVKTYIDELPDIPFDQYYQDYVCRVQDQNIRIEIDSLKSDDILSLEQILARLHKEIR